MADDLFECFKRLADPDDGWPNVFCKIGRDKCRRSLTGFKLRQISLVFEERDVALVAVDQGGRAGNLSLRVASQLAVR